MTYQFYLRNNVLQVRINGGNRGGKERVSLKEKVPEALTFDKITQRITGRSPAASRINSRIVYFESIILNSNTPEEAKIAITNHLTPKSKEEFLLSDMIRDYVEGLDSGAIKSRKGSKMGKSTVSDFKQLLSHYENFGYDINLAEVDLYSLESKERRAATQRCTKFFNQFMDYLVLIELAPSTQNTIKDKLKGVLTWIKKTYAIDVPGEIRSVNVVTDPPEIPIETYEILMNHNLELEGDDIAFDTMMKMQLQTGLRFSDVSGLTIDNFAEGEIVSVSTLNKKSNIRTLAPVPNWLWNKVKTNIKETGYIYRDLNKKYAHSSLNQVFNLFLSRITANLISKNIEVTKQNPDGSVYKTVQPISEIITSHDLRRLTVNYLSAKGVSEMTIKNMTGHTKGSSAYNKHYRLRYAERSLKEVIELTS